MNCVSQAIMVRYSMMVTIEWCGRKIIVLSTRLQALLKGGKWFAFGGWYDECLSITLWKEQFQSQEVSDGYGYSNDLLCSSFSCVGRKRKKALQNKLRICWMALYGKNAEKGAWWFVMEATSRTALACWRLWIKLIPPYQGRGRLSEKRR